MTSKLPNTRPHRTAVAIARADEVIESREFILLIGGASLASPFAARAQQPAMPVIGFLYVRSPEDFSAQVEAFRHGLAEHGYVEGQTVHIEYRWGRGQYDQMPMLATELVRLPATPLVAGAEPSVLAAKAATSNIPIVFVVGTDPIKLGVVASFNKPAATPRAWIS